MLPEDAMPKPESHQADAMPKPESLQADLRKHEQDIAEQDTGTKNPKNIMYSMANQIKNLELIFTNRKVFAKEPYFKYTILFHHAQVLLMTMCIAVLYHSVK